jgi:excinuclease ABC subunit C
MEYPDKPGVYLMKNDTEILYIGKAKSLKHRLSSYFQKAPHEKAEDIMSRTKDITFFVCETEVDALLLESNLIKEYRPKYNIRLKDDTKYPYLKITDEEFPRILVTRDIENGKIYGPFGSAKALRKTLKFMRTLFPLRSCSTMKKKECLEFHIGLCPAPCTDRISKEEYVKNVERLIKFLEGKIDELITELSEDMETASDELDFERAALMRDRIAALEKIRIKQTVNLPMLGDLDIVVYLGEEKRCYTVLLMRRGRIVGKHQYVLDCTFDEFLTQFYTTHLVPPEILFQSPLDPLLTGFLQRKRGSPLTITVPKRGRKKKLIQMAEKDAEIHLKYVYGELELLRDELGLKQVPRRIEGYDISNIRGTHATASQVTFIDGVPSKREYRHYRIRTPGIDDYAMMEEVLQRRFKNREVLPDLILIDGGKGHLNIALRTLQRLGLHIPVIALAKKEEEVFSNPMRPVSDISKKVLIAVRDEAHRFAISYHKKLRKKALHKSILDDIRGIGAKRKKLLMNHFGSISEMKKISKEELNSVIRNKSVTDRVYERLHEPN